MTKLRRGSRRSRLRRTATVVLWGLAVAHVVEALALRRRRAQLQTLGPGTDDVVRMGRTNPPDLDVVSVSGADLDTLTQRAATDEVGATGLRVLDLVPGDLPVERAMSLLRRVDPVRLGDELMYAPGGAHEVLVVERELTERMPAPPPAQAADRGDMHRITVSAQRYAPDTADLRVAPKLRASDQSPEDRWREVEETTAAARNFASVPAVLLGLETAHLLALTGGVLVSPLAGVAALATWSLQPAAVFGRPDAPGLRPRDLPGTTFARLARRWSRLRRSWTLAHEAAQTRAAQRAASPPVLPDLDELFEPRRDTCPWCDGAALTGVLDTPDLLQNKPGEFHLDECTGCGHIFQNPALSLAGLDYYYTDFYDGAGEDGWALAAATGSKDCQPRIDAITRVAQPRAWLDVGTGHGNFCLMARQELPYTRFDGLDLGDGVEEAARRGWIETSYRGLFPELADGMPRSYDVVSMHHYLEHTRDPRSELVAAAKVLEPGGHLLVEVPDPAHVWARRLGRYWTCWLQPQHQHFLPCDNMQAALQDAGFDVVSVERGPATLGNDFGFAVWLAVADIARSPHVPWLPPASLGLRIKRAVVVAAALPFAVVATLADRVKDARPEPDTPGNAYRIVARRR